MEESSEMNYQAKRKKKRKLKGIRLSEQSQCEILLYIYILYDSSPNIWKSQNYGSS